MYKINIKKATELIGLSKREIAKKINVTPQTLSDLEKKEAPMQVIYLHKLSELAGVAVNELIIIEDG